MLTTSKKHVPELLNHAGIYADSRTPSAVPQKPKTITQVPNGQVAWKPATFISTSPGMGRISEAHRNIAKQTE